MPRKKKRTAKQIAATKRLVVFNKKRALDKKVKRTTRRPQRKPAAIKKAVSKFARRRNPARNYNISRLLVIFKYSNGRLYYFDGSYWNASKGKAALFRSKQVATTTARKLSLSLTHMDPTQIGITSESTTAAEIRKKFTGK